MTYGYCANKGGPTAQDDADDDPFTSQVPVKRRHVELMLASGFFCEEVTSPVKLRL